MTDLSQSFVDIPVQTETVHDNSTDWDVFANVVNAQQLSQSWLELLVQQNDSIKLGMVLLKSSTDNAYVPAAIWPDWFFDLSLLKEAAEKALVDRRGVEIKSTEPVFISDAESVYTQIALPIETASDLYGAVVIAVSCKLDSEALQHIRRQLYWGSAWLVQYFLQQEVQVKQHHAERSAVTLDLALLMQEQPDFQKALFMFVNSLAVKLALKRVSLGLVSKGNIKVRAISNTAHFKLQTELSQRLSNVMEEAYDQRRNLSFPYGFSDATSSRLTITLEHQQLAKSGDVGVASFLLKDKGLPFGILVFEYPFNDAVAKDLQAYGAAIAGGLAPTIRQLQELDSWFSGKWERQLKLGLSAVFGPYHTVYKTFATLALLVLAFVLFAEGEFRITAKTTLEGLVQRAAVVPFEGYIDQAPVRAGDTVAAGQIIATLEDKDLKLEKNRLDSEREQTLRKYRDALAKHERSSTSVLAAQLNQTEAELSLVREKLDRSKIRAPYDGIVVSGDLSQMLGAPVEQGKVLFEIAPLDTYRVILKVDERDISYVAVDQVGQLALSGITDDTIPFVVKKVTPVATSEEGLTYFRVEAELERAMPFLRPGMEGIGKVKVGDDKLLWIWTRRLVGWIKISLWTWMP